MRKLLANIQIPIHALIQGSWKWQYGAYRNANVSLSQVTQIWFHLHLPKFQCNGSAWHRWQNGQNWLPKWLQLRYNNTECYWERCWQSMTYMSHGQARYIYIYSGLIYHFVLKTGEESQATHKSIGRLQLFSTSETLSRLLRNYNYNRISIRSIYTWFFNGARVDEPWSILCSESVIPKADPWGETGAHSVTKGHVKPNFSNT